MYHVYRFVVNRKWNTFVGLTKVFLIVLTLFWAARIYNLTKFARFHNTQIGNVCEVVRVKVLSETHLLTLQAFTDEPYTIWILKQLDKQ